MPHCGKGEQQDSATFKMQHFEKGERRIMPNGLHCLIKVKSEQSSSEQQRRQRPDCIQNQKNGLSAGQTAEDTNELLIAMEDSRPGLLNTWTVNGTDFLDSETYLLLESPIYFKEKDEY
ncbi:hypothetical protein STEG23_011135 [Scotinomys teguina]